MLLEDLDLVVGETLGQSDFQEKFGQGVTGKGIEIRYDEKGQKYLWLFAKEGGQYDDNLGTKQFDYVGEDPQGPGVQNPGQEDQELTRGNKELRDAIDTPIPIFLFFKPEGKEGWKYRGQVNVVRSTYKSEGDRHIYEFTLEPDESQLGSNEDRSRETHVPDETERIPDLAYPDRSDTTVSRILRNTPLVKDLKEKYNHTCQVCGEQRQGNNGNPYSEGHHIRPLGSPHNGRDEESNILILCPNHHADFDYQLIQVNPKTLEIKHTYDTEVNEESLTVAENHTINSKSLRYHNQLGKQQ